MTDVTAEFCFRNQEQKLFQTVIVNKGVSQNSTKKPGYQAAAAENKPRARWLQDTALML